jgi:hypothetical protein
MRIAQVIASLAVLGLLARDVDISELARVKERASLGWLLLAVILKSAMNLFHELRLWLAFVPPRPNGWRVLLVGLAANLMNMVLPARGGDLLAIALLRRECGATLGAATAAVGVTGFLEAAAFGLMLLGVLGVGASHWEQIIGADAQQRAMVWVSALTLSGIFAAVLVVWIGRRMAGRASAPNSRGAVALVREALTETGGTLAEPRLLLVNASAAFFQVAGTVCAFALAFPAVGLEVPMPWMAAAGILGLSALASIVFPPTYGAGPAAASVAVLGVMGIDTAGALAYTAAWWLVAHVSAVGLGLPALLFGLGRQTVDTAAEKVNPDSG